MNAIGFFQAQFCFPIGDDMVTAALVLAGVEPEAQLADIDIQGKELTKAHLLRMVAQTQNGYTEKTSSSDFGATNVVNNMDVAQIRSMETEANRIFKKYGLTEYIVKRNTINIYEDDEG